MKVVMAKNRKNVGLTKETYWRASRAALVRGLDLQDFVENAVVMLLDQKEPETKTKAKQFFSIVATV